MAHKHSDPISSNELQRHLAKYLLHLHVGDRLASIRELAQSYQTSVGSISNALNTLEENGSISIDRRGRMGSFVENRSLGALWTVAETCPMVVGLTLASNLRYEGLATALKKLLTSAGIEAYMIFIRGSRTRLKALKENRCHMVVMSAFAAEALCTKSEEILVCLPNSSFVSGHRVFYRTEPQDLGRAYRVAIDRDSIDQERLTEMEFEGVDVEYVPITFTQIHRLLREGHVDAAVWTEDDMEGYIGGTIRDRPLSNHVLEQVSGKDTCAALVTRAGHETVRAILEDAIDESKLMEILDRVIRGQILPEY